MTASRATRLWRIIAATALVATACGGGIDANDDQNATTSVESTTSTTPVTTTTTSAPGTATTSTTTPPEPGLLLAYGDSFASRRGWPTQYAALAAEELGKEFEVRGEVCTLGCSDMIAVLVRANTKALLAKADIVVVQPRPGRVFSKPFNSYLDGTCGGEDGQECIRTALDDFRLYLHDLLDAVTGPVAETAVIRTAPAGTWAIDYFYPELRDKDPDTFSIFIQAMVEYIGLVEQESSGRCILMSDASALFNGEDYTQRIDPGHTRDGAHPSDEGSRLIAEDLHSLGYESTAQSC